VRSRATRQTITGLGVAVAPQIQGIGFGILEADGVSLDGINLVYILSHRHISFSPYALVF